MAIFYANRLVVNSFKDLNETALNQMRRSKDLAASTSGAGNQIQTLSLGPESYTIEFLPLEGEEKPWENIIVVGVNRRELEPTLLTLKLVIFGVGGAAALIGGLLSFWLSSGMRRQIAHLAEGTRRAARDELAGAIPVTSRDELGELAKSFNAMTLALGEKTRLLQEERDRVAANADFLAMIVHDIKAPLTGVRLTIEALEDETLPPEIHNKLQGIIQRSEGLLLHLHNVLDLSRFEAGKLVLRPEAVPPGFILQRLLHHFGPLAQHQGVALTAPPLPPLPPILVDEPSLDRVLSNLLVNALAATPKGGQIQAGGPGPGRFQAPARWRSPWPTPAAASSRKNKSTCSKNSACPVRPRTAPAWGSISARPWWRPTTGASGWKAKPAGAPPFIWPYRPRSRRRRPRRLKGKVVNTRSPALLWERHWSEAPASAWFRLLSRPI